MEKGYTKLVKSLKTVLFVIVILILILSFSVWGISDVVKNLMYSSNAAVEIDGKKISNQYIDSNFRQILHTYGNNNNTTISVEDGVKVGLLDMSVKKIVSEIAFDEEAKQVGILINDDLAAKQIEKDEFFKDENGKFDSEKFKKIIVYSGFANEKQFIENLKQEKARANLLSIVKSGVQSNDYMVSMLDKYDREIRSSEYIILPFDESSVSPTEEELKHFYKDNLDLYRKAELNDITIMAITKEDVTVEGLSEEEIMDEVLAMVDLTDTLLADEISLEDIASEIGVKAFSIKDVNISNVKEAKELKSENKELTLSENNINRALRVVQELKYSDVETKISQLRETNDGDYFVVRIDATRGNEPKEFSEVEEEVKSKYIKETAEDIKRKEGVDLVKRINAGEITLEDISKDKNLKITKSIKFHRTPTAEELKEMSPIAIAQLFAKEKVGEAGISILKDGVFVFILDSIEYEDTKWFKKAEYEDYLKQDNAYAIIESFANAMLEKYNAKINYDALDRIYSVE